MRIVCLSAEAADICARIGAWDQVVAVSCYAPQDGLPRRPVISGFSSCDVARALELSPDLVVTFSDVQAGMAGDFIRAGCTVLALNQRSIPEITAAIRMIGRVTDRLAEAEELVAEFRAELFSLAGSSEPRPRVYFEEWPDPLVSGIGWVGEIVELIGGIDVFADRRGPRALDRTVSLDEIVAARPDIVLASWCGKAVDLPSIRSRPGFSTIPAVARDQVFALDSNVVLQPGPRVIEGARQIRRILDRWRAGLLRSG